ncbi:MAG: hypothetical protein HQM02_01755 [Magnetococcales bacterium]|nr:hypothetical protein [Magnetococcales bacterium]
MNMADTPSPNDPPQSREKVARRWTPVWTSLGAKAYWRSFVCGRFGCASGGRDFAWLTLLLALVICMALLLVGTRAGLLERFTDALLGTLRPSGVPVWVTAHWENHQGIGTDLLGRLKEMEKKIPGESFGVTTHPYRQIGDSSPKIRLPGSGTWDSGSPWIGWAVYPDDPLWNMELPKEWNEEQSQKSDGWLGLPLTVVLSESLFAEGFNYESYREAIQPILRQKKLRRLPEKPPQDSLRNALDAIWLDVGIGNTEELVPFRVRWVHHIPAMEKVAFLFPLSTYHALLAAFHFPEIRFDVKSKGIGDSEEYRRLTAASYPKGEIAAHAQCLQEELTKSGLLGLPKVSENRCARPQIPAPAGYQRQGGGDEGWDVLNHDDNHRLWMPCHRLPHDNPLRESLCANGRPKAGQPLIYAPWDVTESGTSFSAVRIYMPDPTRLSKGIRALMSVRTKDGRPAFNIHSMYQDALNRFNLLSDLLSTMTPAYAVTFGIFLGALLLAQAGTLIGHRRHHYGILLSRGFTWTGIYGKLLWQMFLATLTAGCVAVFGMIPALRYLLDDGFKGIISRYQDLLPPGYDFEALPLPWQEILITIGEVYAVVACVTIFLLLRLPLRGDTAPSDLLHGGGVAPRDRDGNRKKDS